MYPEDDRPYKVPQKTITSLDVVSFNGGLDERGEFNGDPNSFVYSKNAMINERGLLTFRYVLRRWLPDTVGTIHEILPVIYNGEMFYYTADDGKMKWCQAGDTSWTDCGGGVVNAVTMTAGTIVTLLRVMDKILVMNGVDKLKLVDIPTKTVTAYTAVDDPTNAPTLTATGITASGSHKVYYGISFNSTVGETALSPILTQAVSKPRDAWKDDGTEYVDIARNNTAPTGATSWNLYMALAPAGASIDTTDMLMIAGGLDLSVTQFIDNGTAPVNIDHGVASEDNSTDGPTCTHGIEAEGRPILFGDADDPYSLRIGGDGDHALDFSPTNGGYRLILNKGTNYYPVSAIGFRNGQGQPSLTVLHSNTQGLSKQSIVEQQTVTYGNYSFVVWGSTEQNYGAAGVSSPYGVVNASGGLHFPSTNGIMRMDTEASLQNVLSIKRTSNRVKDLMASIRNESLPGIVGTAWSDRIYWTIPSRGYTENNQILVGDISNKESTAWYTYDIRAQWIGTVSPDDEPAFVYVCQDNHIFKLVEGYAAIDDNADGTTESFAVEARGPFLGRTEAHNSFDALIQAVFYFTEFVGDVYVGVNYRNENGVLKYKEKLVSSGGSYEQGSGGGWDSPEYLYGGETPVLEWAQVAEISEYEPSTKTSKRGRVPLNVVSNEAQWYIRKEAGDRAAFVLRSISLEGLNIGIKADLR